jgi:hypothetical protein
MLTSLTDSPTGDILPGDMYAATRGTSKARDRLDQLILPVPGNASDAQNLTSPYRETDAFHGILAATVRFDS